MSSNVSRRVSTPRPSLTNHFLQAEAWLRLRRMLSCVRAALASGISRKLIYMQQPWSCGPQLSHEQYAEVIETAAFDYYKWHLQVEDDEVLCRFPLLITTESWAEVSRLSIALAAEALQAENELLERRDLHRELGLPPGLRRCLGRIGKSKPTPGPVRVMRFDFHWTTEGWKISEGNTDVAGGFIEASGLTQIFCTHYRDWQPTGDPAGVLSGAIRRVLAPKAVVGLMHLTVYSEDHQIMLYLASRITGNEIFCCHVGPEQIRWTHGRAMADTAAYSGPVHLVVRFFPAEWLPKLSRGTGWEGYAHGGITGVCNPAYAVLIQSKRFPLVWDKMHTSLPTWRALLPETRSPRDVEPGMEDQWVYKPALGYEGRDVAIEGVTDPQNFARIHRAALSDPGSWVAQRRFVPIPLNTPRGTLFPCLGVYIIDGRVAGAYGRAGVRPIIDDRSREIVVLQPRDATQPRIM
jgi:glutathionylspermidine synthase